MDTKELLTQPDPLDDWFEEFLIEECYVGEELNIMQVRVIDSLTING
jgi:hypothetical protein